MRASFILLPLLLAACAGNSSLLKSNDSGGISTTAVGRAENTQIDQNASLPLSMQNTPEAVAAREASARAGLSTKPTIAEESTAAAVETAPAAASPPAMPAAPAAPARPAASVPPQPSVPAPAVAAATGSSVVASTNPHDKIDGFAKGAKVHVRGGAPLYARPSTSSDTVQAIAVTTPVELGPQIYNAGGFWYYVALGKETGWLLQSDLLP